MKHVGLNVAADALMPFSYIGVNAGLVLVVCDDPGIHSSQNEEDARIFADFAHVPVLEPSDRQEALEFSKYAFGLLEKFDTLVIVRATTRLSHTRSEVTVGERINLPPRKFDKNSKKNAMVLNNARNKHPIVQERERRIAAEFDTSPLNKIERNDIKVGIVTVGMSYVYVKEVFPEASILKLASNYPMTENLVRDFCDKVDRIIVVEELEPVIENAMKIMGFTVEGKSLFPRTGDFHQKWCATGLSPPDCCPKRSAKAALNLPDGAPVGAVFGLPAHQLFHGSARHG